MAALSMSLAPAGLAGSKVTSARRSVSGTPLRAAAPRASVAVRKSAIVTSSWQAEEGKTSVKDAACKLAAGALAGIMAVGPMTALPAMANEFDILSTPTPTRGYVLDDAKALSRAGASAFDRKAKELEEKTGYRVVVVTTRKLQFVPDSFEFADKVIENWYPTAELGDKKGVLLLVTSGKEGALVGGPSFSKAIGNDLLESIVLENIPILTAEERYSEAAMSVLDRVGAAIENKEDPGPPNRAKADNSSNFKSREETLQARSKFTTIVVALLAIAFVVPMVQFYAYTKE